MKNELREQDPKSYDGGLVRQIRLSTLAALISDSHSAGPFSHSARREKLLARFSNSKHKCLLRLEAWSGEFPGKLERPDSVRRSMAACADNHNHSISKSKLPGNLRLLFDVFWLSNEI